MNDQLIKIRQLIEETGIADVREAVSREMPKLQGFLRPGSRIAVAVGSRGISNLVPVVKEVVAFLKKNGAIPFIVPAMGSHGGSTSEGQSGILTSYGISEKSIGVPVRSSMEVVELDRGECPVPVYMDKLAHASDGVILINRIKPHTDYHAAYESGLVKMAVIGLGKEKQASVIHHQGVYGLSNLIPVTARQVFSTGKILGGIALVENAREETMLVEVLRSDEIFDREPVLLEVARKNMPALPVLDIDVLIIDQMGKDISGVGMDTNVIGRIRIAGQQEPVWPRIKTIVLLDLSEKTHGNAIGIGLADVITRRVFEKIDFQATYANAITSSFLERVKIPVIADNDRKSIEIALRSCGMLEEGRERIVRIKNTLSLEELYVSGAIWEEIEDSQEIETLASPASLFGKDHRCKPF